MAEAIDLTGDEAPGDLQHLEKQLIDVEEELQEVEETLQALRDRQLQLRQQKEELQRRITAEKRAPKADWSNAAFEWDAQLKDALQTVFGLSAFRPLQHEVMNATLHGDDVLLLLPSGGGKSLCYQLPALISGGVTLVVSPLLSLIIDQVMGLSGRVQAYALTSLTSKEEVATVMAALTSAAAATAKGQPSAAGGSSSNQALLLYVTPEKIVASKRLMSKLEKVYQAGRLSRIAIDEAHCCSTWGNDFRPDYKKLGVLKQQFPETPIIALTATATLQVCRDVKSILQISGAEQFTASIDRPNLCYEVMHKPAGADAAAKDIRDWIRDNYPNGESGIVYCLTRKDCEVLASQLQSGGITAAHYHADMEPAARQASHSNWSSGDVQVMVATIAFGMGINKPDVRWVLHACLSKSLENYYQESGRAGRDGQPARCVLCYRLADVLRQASVVCMDPNWHRHLLAMTSYAAAADGCRRAALAAHFGEGPPPCNGMCDLCKAAGSSASAVGANPSALQPQKQDLAPVALLAVTALKARKNDKRATLNQLLDDLQKASRNANSSKRGSDSCSREELEWTVEQMLLHGLLAIEFGFTAYTTNSYLVTTAAGEALHTAQGNKRFMVTRPSWLAKQQSAGTAQHIGSGAASGVEQDSRCAQKQLQQQQPQQQQPVHGHKKRARSITQTAAETPPHFTSDSDDFEVGPA